METGAVNETGRTERERQGDRLSHSCDVRSCKKSLSSCGDMLQLAVIRNTLFKKTAAMEGSSERRAQTEKLNLQHRPHAFYVSSMIN